MHLSLACSHLVISTKCKVQLILSRTEMERGKGLKIGTRYWRREKQSGRAAWLNSCQVSIVMIYSSLHPQYEVRRCRWDTHWDEVSECERIQLVWVTEGAAGYSETLRKWTHSLHMAKPSTATSTGGFAGAFTKYSCIMLGNSVRQWNHIVVLETICPPITLRLFWGYLCAPIINLLA